MGWIGKAGRWIASDIRNRGWLPTLYMLIAHGIALVRGFLFKLMYPNNLEGALFSLQRNSSIEIFHRQAKVRVGRFAFIRKNVSIRVDHSGELVIGDKVFINDNCNINCVGRIQIGEYTKIAPNVCINDHDHNYKLDGGGHLLLGEVRIGKHVWIGAGAVVLRDTTIGDYAVIAAGSIVKGEVAPHTLYYNKREPSHKAIRASGGAAR